MYQHFTAVSKRKYFAPRALLRLRDRYLFTRHNRLRLRYASMVVLCLAVIVGVMVQDNDANSSVNYATDVSGVELGALPHTQVAFDHDDGLQHTRLDEQVKSPGVYELLFNDSVRSRISKGIRSAPDIIKKAKKPDYKTVTIGSGQTIAGVIQKAGVSGGDSYNAIMALKAEFDPRKVKPGHSLKLYFNDGFKGRDPEFYGPVKEEFAKLVFPISSVKEVVVSKGDEGEFVATAHEKELQRKVYGRYAEIQTSLYGSATRANIPSSVIAEMIRIYSWNVDFQRDVRRGDKVQVLYDVKETEDGTYSRFGDILYASLNIGGREKPIYRFEMDDGRIDYFEKDGTSIRKTLMKTPVDGARISSGFGMRHHPVLGYSKMHKGMDFAAPTGTPIYAAGDGVVERAGRNGAYGNYVRLRHNSKLKTAYAHMSKIKSGVTRGSRVKQGQIIGYIGTTGRSTGPHLHYEVLVNGTQVNPRNVDLPTGETLQAQDMKRFKALVSDVDKQYASLTRGVDYASRDHKDDKKPSLN